MIGRTKLALGVATVAFTLAGAGQAHAQAMGVTTSPSTFMQCMGYGFGAGYHAPIVRSPWQEPARARRLMFAPPCYGPLGPAPYVMTGCSGGCATGQCGYGGPGYAPPTGGYTHPASGYMSTEPTAADEAAMRNYRVAQQYRWP